MLTVAWETNEKDEKEFSEEREKCLKEITEKAERPCWIRELKAWDIVNGTMMGCFDTHVNKPGMHLMGAEVISLTFLNGDKHEQTQ